MWGFLTPDKHVWSCFSEKGLTTIAKYAHYQANSFQESLKEEQDRIASGQKPEEFKKKKHQLNKTIKVCDLNRNVPPFLFNLKPVILLKTQ